MRAGIPGFPHPSQRLLLSARLTSQPRPAPALVPMAPMPPCTPPCSFALVSESDLPLYDPLTFYQQLVSEPKSRVNACVHGARTEQRWTDELKVRGRIRKLGMAGWRLRLSQLAQQTGVAGCGLASPARALRTHILALSLAPCNPPCLQTEHLQQGHWRKSGQFLGLTREHVELVLNDEEVYRS